MAHTTSREDNQHHDAKEAEKDSGKASAPQYGFLANQEYQKEDQCETGTIESPSSCNGEKDGGKGD